MPKISVVTPVYKSFEMLDELYTRLCSTLQQIDSDYEIIMVEDCGGDGSWEMISELAQKDNRIKGIQLSRNFGQHYAITTGLDYAKGDWVVVMDCDLQDQPEEIIKFYNKAKEGYDIVYGSRKIRHDSFFKKLSSNVFYKLLSYLTETRQDGSIANFGIYSRKVVDSVKSMKENLRYLPVMVNWVGFKSTTVPVEHAARKSGKSAYTLHKLINLALNVIIAFSDKPLRLTVKLGLLVSLMSMVYAVYIIIRAYLGLTNVQGWPSLIVSIWFFSGVIIFIMGIIGIYIGKIFDEVKRRPLYIIKNTTFHI